MPLFHKPESGSSIHWLIVIQIQPAFDQTIDNPDSAYRKDNYPHKEKIGDCTQHHPQQSIPERPDLPAEMAFHKGTGHFFLFDVIYDDSHNPCYPQKKRCRIKGIDHCSQCFQGFLRLCCCYIFHHSPPFLIDWFFHTGTDSLCELTHSVPIFKPARMDSWWQARIVVATSKREAGL